jgi:hypothetical protein
MVAILRDLAARKFVQQLKLEGVCESISKRASNRFGYSKT